MVSLEQRGEYLKGILENEKFLIFYNFLVSNGTSVIGESTNSVDVIDDVFRSLLLAICNSNGQDFQKHYSQYSSRTPSPTSPFVNDDFLLFSLIIGVKKFGLSQEWVEKVLQARQCSSDDCNQTLITFKNILLQNYNSLDNHLGIILVFQNILNNNWLLPTNKAKLYTEITSSIFPSKRSDFLNIIELRAYDLLIKEQLFDGNGEYQLYKDMVQSTNIRINQLSRVFLYLLCALLILPVVYGYFKHDRFKEFVQDFEALFGFLGIAGIIFWRDGLISYCEKTIKIFFFCKKL